MKFLLVYGRHKIDVSRQTKDVLFVGLGGRFKESQPNGDKNIVSGFAADILLNTFRIFLVKVVGLEHVRFGQRWVLVRTKSIPFKGNSIAYSGVAVCSCRPVLVASTNYCSTPGIRNAAFSFIKYHL